MWVQAILYRTRHAPVDREGKAATAALVVAALAGTPSQWPTEVQRLSASIPPLQSSVRMAPEANPVTGDPLGVPTAIAAEIADFARPDGGG